MFPKYFKKNAKPGKGNKNYFKASQIKIKKGIAILQILNTKTSSI